MRLLDGHGYFLHAGGALILFQDLDDEHPADEQGEDGGGTRKSEDRPLTALQGEALPAAFCCE